MFGYIGGGATEGENDMVGGDGEAEGQADLKDVRLFLGRDATDALPSGDSRGWLANVAGHLADAAEQRKDRGELLHGPVCAAISNTMQQQFQTDSVQDFRIAAPMGAVGPLLKELRLAARPRLSIRKIAEALGIPSASYNFYEREQGYKKPFLPIDFARKVAAVLADHGVDPADVMQLAGLGENEAEPEGRAIEAARPPVQFVTLQVALPNEAALSDMFETMLVQIPEGASRAEAARILAQSLPTGLAAIGPVVPDPANIGAPAAPSIPAPAAANRRAVRRPSRS